MAYETLTYLFLFLGRAAVDELSEHGRTALPANFGERSVDSARPARSKHVADLKHVGPQTVDESCAQVKSELCGLVRARARRGDAPAGRRAWTAERTSLPIEFLLEESVSYLSVEKKR